MQLHKWLNPIVYNAYEKSTFTIFYVAYVYRTRAIITRSWLETALEY